VDWPLTYDDLEPHYDTFEWTVGITGRAGNLNGVIQEGGNPFEGPRTRDYPLPPLEQSETAELFRATTDGLGLHPFPNPVGNLSARYTNRDGIIRDACTYCGTCMRHACAVGAKADPVVTVLPVALSSSSFELRPHARVFEICHEHGRATGVRYYDAAGRVYEQRASIVILAAYALGNVRLLLLSGLGQPYDPVANHGVVGRNYTYQTMVDGAAFFRGKTFRRYMGATGTSYVVDDFNAHNFDHVPHGFIGGGNLMGGATAAAPISGIALPPDVPDWGPAWKEALREWYDRSLFVAAIGESLPYRDHYLDLDPTYKDHWGHPLLRITFNWRDNERRMGRYLSAKLRDIFAAMNADSIALAHELRRYYDTSRYQATHNNGGAIMGDDPSTSVVNRYLQMWDCENVFVVGASAFPHNPGYGPTGTVCALAYMTADAIVRRYRVRDGSLV
jgi:gluconate 2-dehydrogenase alpha chain